MSVAFTLLAFLQYIVFAAIHFLAYKLVPCMNSLSEQQTRWAMLDHLLPTSGELVRLFMFKFLLKYNNIKSLFNCLDQTPPTISTVNDVTVSCGDDLSPSVTGTPIVSDNVDSDVQLSFVDQPSISCMLRRVWTAVDTAGNDASYVQTITFTNPMPPIILAPNSVAIPCGSIETAIQDVGRATLSVTHPCGRPLTTTFTDSSTVTACGFNFTRTWTIQDDCGSRSTFQQTIRVLHQQFPDSPSNGQLNVRLDEPLLWPQYPGATTYRVYVWIFESERPQEPTSIVQRRRYTTPTNYPQATRLLWQIEYVIQDLNMTIPSPIWGFQTQSLPNLAATTVEVPSFAFSGQQFDVSWTVTNLGNLGITTTTYWYDSLYIGPTNDFSLSRRVQRVFQRRFIDPQDGYVSEATIDLFPSEVGTIYVFIVVDSSYQVRMCLYSGPVQQIGQTHDIVYKFFSTL